MKTFFLLISLALALNVICDSPSQLIFNKFLDKSPEEIFEVFHTVYNRDYELSSQEGQKRLNIFKQNLKLIKETNSKRLPYTFGINQFTDLTNQEFRERHLTFPNALKAQMQSFYSLSNQVPITGVVGARGNIDWKSLFNAPRNQGSCGSCWAFTTAGIVESNWWKKNQSKAKINLAPQHLVDCDTGNGGCNGGWYEAALRFVMGKGIVEEKYYPYKGVKGTCRVPSTAPKYKVTNFSYCDSCTMDQWWALFQQGPIAIAVDANQFQFYQSGIYSLQNCGQINHAIIASGWTLDSEGEVLSIRNSWGSTWGEQGYMRIRVNLQDQTCGALNYAYLPIV